MCGEAFTLEGAVKTNIFFNLKKFQFLENFTSSAVYDTAIQDAEARLEALRAEEAVLEKRIGARTQSALVIDEGILQLAVSLVTLEKPN